MTTERRVVRFAAPFKRPDTGRPAPTRCWTSARGRSRCGRSPRWTTGRGRADTVCGAVNA
jgi:hypothetical protein